MTPDTTLDLIVCETCRRRDDADAAPAADAPPHGAQFAEALRQRLASEPALAAARVETMKCLMACSRACTLHLRQPGKMGYVLGGLGPEDEHLDAVVDYLKGYLDSADGVVPFRQWPQGVKGKFVARVPAL